MRIFVSGATGFLGSHLVPLLRKKKHKLFLLSRSRGGKDFIKGDIGKPNAWYQKLEKFKPEATIHLAWEGVADYQKTPPEVAFLNLENSLELIKLLSKIGCKRFVGLGSVMEYSQNLTPFTASKIALRGFGEALSLASGIQFLWARPFYVYGPGQRPQALLPTIINSLLDGKDPEIKNPMLVQDFIYVDDVAEALLRIAEMGQEETKVYEIGRGKAFPIGTIANIAYKQLGLSEPYDESSVSSGDDVTPIADIAPLGSLGWMPKTDFKKGISKMIEFYKS